MKNKVFDYYKELPAWAKGVVIVGGIAIVYFTTKQFIGRIKKQNKLAKENEVINTQKAETKKLEETGLRATFNDSQYKAWADSLQSQFDGCDVSIVTYIAPSVKSYSGTALYSIIDKFKNDIDFLKLQTAWGIREYDQCGWFTGNVKGSLGYCVNDELDPVEIKAINKLLEKKGITYRF